MSSRTFLLSPAFCGGRRAQILLNGSATFELAARLRLAPVPIGEVFAFLSGLYFRGKLTYARRFSADSTIRVITPDRGLVPLDYLITVNELKALAGVEVNLRNPRYVIPLTASLQELDGVDDKSRAVVLLGSIATNKYSGVLLPRLGRRLLYPSAFRGIGDMSRGALLLRAAASGNELAYETVPSVPTKRRKNVPVN